MTFILPGSISHTLPAAAGLIVSCYLNTQSDPTTATIICDNIGKMYATSEYKIGCRITFPYDLFTSPLEPNFGTMTLYSVTNFLLLLHSFLALRSTLTLGASLVMRCP